MQQERERPDPQEWAHPWVWDETRIAGAGPIGVQADGRGVPAADYWLPEPTARSHQTPASSSWEEDKDPTTITMERVHEDIGTHLLKA